VLRIVFFALNISLDEKKGKAAEAETAAVELRSQAIRITLKIPASPLIMPVTGHWT
jgi:hypothetical protein